MSDPPPYRKYRASRFGARRKSPPAGPESARAAARGSGAYGPRGEPVASPPPPRAGQAREASPPQGQMGPSAPPPTPAARAGRRLRVPGAGRAGRWTCGWVVRKALKLALAWVVISLIVFLISAQIHQSSIDGAKLGGAGFPLTSPNTILVLGSDARPAGKGEPGSGGASRSDTIMLLRVGGGANAKLSIPRDTLVAIPGHGLDKINAAYAYGGAALSVRTVEQYLGIDVNHVIELDFENFPKLIDAMGGVTYRGGCVVSKINGGFKNGGYTLRLPAGKSHLDGKQALALARTRKNLCNPREDDIARARRQQKIVSAMKRRMLSPGAFVRLPWIAWQTPQALRSDMSGFTQLGMFGGIIIGGGSSADVLRPSGVATSPGGGAALTVSESERRRAVARLMAG